MSDSVPHIVCFGEILWDFLPEGAFPGGAPFNVAYHLHQYGLTAHLASAVGADVLGDELLRRLRGWGIPTAGIARLEGLPTGYVRASVGASGDACYEIVPDVAWDRIPAERSLDAAHAANAIVFGSLAQRSLPNREALETLLRALPAGAVRVFDVNLRPPHDDLSLVRTLASRATLLKLNAQEAARLCEDRTADAASGSATSSAVEETHARRLASESGCRTVVVTCGARGAGLLREGRWHWEPGRRVVVVDTVGAGDSFLAALLAALLSGEGDGAALARACRIGEWVASRRGATPVYDATAPR